MCSTRGRITMVGEQSLDLLPEVLHVELAKGNAKLDGATGRALEGGLYFGDARGFTVSACRRS